MRRLAYVVAVGLVGAGIVHIAILFLMPPLSDRDAWAQLASVADAYALVPLAPGGPINVSDPQFEAAACRFDLSESVAHVASTGRVPFWSVSVYDRGGQNLYSFNDRTAVDGSLDLVIATASQMIELRKTLPEAYEKSVFVETASDLGIAVVRAFVPDEGWRDQVRAYLGAVTCEPA